MNKRDYLTYLDENIVNLPKEAFCRWLDLATYSLLEATSKYSTDSEVRAYCYNQLKNMDKKSILYNEIGWYESEMSNNTLSVEEYNYVIPRLSALKRLSENDKDFDIPQKCNNCKEIFYYPSQGWYFTEHPKGNFCPKCAGKYVKVFGSNL